MGHHKQQLVMGGGQYQLKKLCIWGMFMVLPFLVLFCIFPSGSSVIRPRNDRNVVSKQLPLQAAHSDLAIVSSNGAVDREDEEEEGDDQEDQEGRVSILDEPDFGRKRARKHRGGKKLKKQKEMENTESLQASPKKKVRKHTRRKRSDDPIITPLTTDKELDEQTHAEDVQPEESSTRQKINHDEEIIPETANEPKTSFSGNRAADQDEAATAADTFRHGRHKLDKEEEPEEEISSSGKDPASSEPGSSKKKGSIPSEESNAAAAGDAVLFPDMEKTDDTIADHAEAMVSLEREEQSSEAKESSTEDSPEEDDRAGSGHFFTKQSGKCKYHEGKWIIDSTKSLEDATCTLMSIDDNQQSCALEKNKTEPVRWRWQPTSCKVEHFNAEAFLRMMQSKSLAFVGDKLAGAQMESLLCLLAEVEKPNLIYDDKTNKSSAWRFSSSNFTVSMLWSPHLVQEASENGYKKLHLDNLETRWAVMVPTIDVLILGVGSRFIEPAMYAVYNEVVGCSLCKDLIGQNGFANTREMSLYSGFRAAMRSALMGIGSLPGYEGITLFLQPYGLEGNGSFHLVSKKMKEIQEEELGEAYKRGNIYNPSKMEVLHTDFISSQTKHDNMQGPTTSTCLVPSPLANTWNENLQHTLTRLLVSQS